MKLAWFVLVVAAALALGCSGDDGGLQQDAAVDAASADAGPDATTCDEECLFAATFPIEIEYTPMAGAERQVYTMQGETSTEIIEFHFDEANGTFEYRSGGSCTPTQDNPDFVKYTIRANNADLVSCTVRASWDMFNFECPGFIVDLINSQDGLKLELNTDQYRTNPESLCEFLDELHFPHDTFGWIQITFATESATVTKRMNLFKEPLP